MLWLLGGLVASGCGASAEDHLRAARRGLADAAYADALSAAEAGLAAGPGEVTRWGLELVKLEAHARSGEGEAARRLIERLAAEHPDHLPVTQYAATAHQLRATGQGPAAIEVLDLAMRRFPGDPMIERLIAASASGAPGVDSDELEMLRSLGYIE
jgi:hypothetical protein